MIEDFITAGVNLDFSYAAGETASRFLIALRDEMVIYGTRCPDCSRVLVPARSFCPRCTTGTDEWMAVGPAGDLIAFAAIHQPEAHHPLAEPFAFALIRLDGADVNFVHLVAGTPPDTLAVGMRVKAVFAPERTGSIRDIAHFKIIQQED